MKFSDFRRLLGTEPNSQDPEFLAARRAGGEFAQAAERSDRFESALRDALAVEIPEDLQASLLAIGEQQVGENEPAQERNRGWIPYALAAGLLLALSVGFLLPRYGTSPEEIQRYAAEHYGHDGARVLAMAVRNSVAAETLDEQLADIGFGMDPQLAGQVRLVKACPTPGGGGLHMVLATDQGLVTLILMPGVEMPLAQQFAFQNMQVNAVPLPAASATALLIGSSSQLSETLRQEVESSVHRAANA